VRTFPPPEARWRPSPEAGIKPLDPGPTPGITPEVPRDPQAQLRPPQVGEAQRPGDPGSLPVDIPQFAFARKNVASGQKPFIDGLDWLRARGYRTVLHVRSPGENDSVARRQFEARGFRYISLEVSPTTLSRELVEAFNRIVTDPANLPLFAYDRDSSLLGGLWYLHFRTYEGYAHERAAIKAGELGLNIDADAGPHRDMWLAIQRFLQISKPTKRPVAKVHTAGWIRER
jgi:hypothetical protein